MLEPKLEPVFFIFAEFSETTGTAFVARAAVYLPPLTPLGCVCGVGPLAVCLNVGPCFLGTTGADLGWIVGFGTGFGAGLEDLDAC